MTFALFPSSFTPLNRSFTVQESLEFLFSNLEAFVLVIGGTLVLQFAIHYCVVALRRWWATTSPVDPEPEPDEYDDEDDPSDLDDPTEVWPEDMPNEFPDLPEMPDRQSAWGSPLTPRQSIP
jgi:hypothetical protein